MEKENQFVNEDSNTAGVSSEKSGNLVNCPNCGQLIQPLAKKCKYCGKWIDEEFHQYYTDKLNLIAQKNIDDGMDVCFIPNELSLFEKFLVVYWAVSKSWKLESFKYSKGILTVELANSDSISGPLKAMDVRWGEDNRGKQYTITYKDQKLHFTSMAFALEEEEWQQIDDIMMKAGYVEKSKIQKAAEIMNFVKKIFGQGD